VLNTYLFFLSQFVCPALPVCPSGFAHLWWYREACLPFNESIGIEISKLKAKQKRRTSQKGELLMEGHMWKHEHWAMSTLNKIWVPRCFTLPERQWF
jgi:hypothetical protein